MWDEFNTDCEWLIIEWYTNLYSINASNEWINSKVVNRHEWFVYLKWYFLLRGKCF